MPIGLLRYIQLFGICQIFQMWHSEESKAVYKITWVLSTPSPQNLGCHSNCDLINWSKQLIAHCEQRRLHSCRCIQTLRKEVCTLNASLKHQCVNSSLAGVLLVHHHLKFKSRSWPSWFDHFGILFCFSISYHLSPY